MEKKAYKNIISNTNITELKNFGKFLHKLKRKLENKVEKNGARFRGSEEGGIKNRNALFIEYFRLDKNLWKQNKHCKINGSQWAVQWICTRKTGVISHVQRRGFETQQPSLIYFTGSWNNILTYKNVTRRTMKNYKQFLHSRSKEIWILIWLEDIFSFENSQKPPIFWSSE